MSYVLPRVVYQSTNYSREVIPDLWGSSKDGFTFELANNADITTYMHTHNVTPSTPSIFDIASGIHKANLYQATVVYNNGGAYFDIKSIGILPLGTIIAEHHDRPTIYTVVSRLNGRSTIHIGMMAATRRHPLMLNWLEMMLKAGSTGLLNHFRPNRFVCDSLYSLFQQHFGLPWGGSNASSMAHAGVYESSRYGRLVLWEQIYDHNSTRCRWKHTGFRPMMDRYGTCSLVINSSYGTCPGGVYCPAEPILGVRDPTYPLSWARREANRSRGLPISFDPSAKAEFSGRATAGDGFFTMNKNELTASLGELKDKRAAHTQFLKEQGRKSKGKYVLDIVKDLQAAESIPGLPAGTPRVIERRRLEARTRYE